MRLRRLLPAIVSFAAAGACGPSFQAIYEGNARFEHCYALEENPNIGMHEKGDCWHDWSERYTYGQTRDRIAYAIARYVALSEASNVPTDEAVMMAAPGVTPREQTITAPAPTSANEPPPKVLGTASATAEIRPSEMPVITVGGGGPASPPEAPPLPLPARDCAGKCAATYQTCTGNACEATYKKCMESCFK